MTKTKNIRTKWPHHVKKQNNQLNINNSNNNNNNNEQNNEQHNEPHNRVRWIRELGERLIRSVSVDIGLQNISTEYNCEKCHQFYEMNYYSRNIDRINNDIEYLRTWKDLSNNKNMYDTLIKQLNFYKEGKQYCTNCIENLNKENNNELWRPLAFWFK